MDTTPPESKAFHSLDQQIERSLTIIGQIQQYFLQKRPAVVPISIYEAINQLEPSTALIRREAIILDDERRSLQALAQIGQVVNSSLDLDVVLQIVMDTIIRLTKAERGFLMLRNEQKELVIRVARNWEQESIEPGEFAVSRTVIYRVANDGTPVLTTNAQEDPRFTGQKSVVAHNLRSILCVPLIVKKDSIGVIYADNRIRSGLFTQKELDLLVAFANQAAVAIDNARLFASVRRTLAEVTELKNFMDNVFASMASGVITADIEERVLLCNRAAAAILGHAARDLVGSDLNKSIPSLKPFLEPYLRRVIDNDQQILGLEAHPSFPERGQIDLSLSLAPLKDVHQTTQGIAIVMEDLTEKKKLEGKRRLFERMVSPAVIEQLDPDSIKMGGQRAEITILFADIRGFTGLSERLQPEELVSILNRYMAAAADVILGEEGTVDKFLGDAVMAWFNAPIRQPDHTLRAVRAGIAIRDATRRLHKDLPQDLQLMFGVGIHTGIAVLGMVGTEKRLDYTAIGDSVNTSRRIQENALPGQILVSQDVVNKIANAVQIKPVGPILAKGKRDPIPVFEVLSLI